MKSIKRWAGTILAIAIAMLASAASAQVLQQVPADALVVFKVNNLKATSDKIAKASQDLGMVAMQPALGDPLAMLQGISGISQGLNSNGEFAVAMMDPALTGNDPSRAILVYMPVSDYKAFLANSKQVQTDGEISQVNFNGPMFAVNWGQYAVLSNTRDLVARKPSAALTAPSVTAKELATKDMVLYANFTALRAKALPHLQQAQTDLGREVDRTFNTQQFAKFKPVIKAVMTQAFNVFEGFLNEAQAGTVGMALSDDGLTYSVVTEFKSGGYATQNITSMKNTDASLLSNLPDAKYIVYGGAVSDPQRALKVITDLLDPIVKEVLAVGPEMAPAADYFDIVKTQVSSVTGQSFGVIAPSGAPIGTESIVQALAIQRGDAKTLAALMPKAIDVEQRLMKALVPAGMEAMMPAPTHTVNAMTVDGISFNAIVNNLPPPPANANAQTKRIYAQQQQAMAIFYGPKGFVMNYAPVGDKLLIVTGLNEDAIKSAIAAAKSSAAPLESTDGYKEVSAKLPKQRIAVAYFDLAQLATTSLSYAKQFGFAMPVQLAPGLPPIGAAVSSEAGTAMRCDVYIPKTLVQSMVAAGMQAAMQMQGGPGAPGGPQGGGL